MGVTGMKKAVAFFGLTFLAGTLLVSGQMHSAMANELDASQEAPGLDQKKTRHALGPRFTADRNGIIRDNQTGLQWFLGPDRDTNWHEAKAWVESLEVDGDGWRMPTRGELKNLYKPDSGKHNINPLFRTEGGFAWTDEPVGSSHAWGFCFDIGDAYWPRLTFRDTARAFAVRSRR
jgi:hypothetical protein